MRLSFSVSREDYWQFNKLLVFQIPSLRFNFITNLLAIPLVFFALLWPDRLPLIPAVYISAILGVSGIAVYLWLWKRQVKSQPSDRGDQLGEHVLEIAADGIRGRTSYVESLYSWQAVTDVYENRDYIYIFVDRNKAHVIPKRVLANVEEARQLKQTIVSYWKNAANPATDE